MGSKILCVAVAFLSLETMTTSSFATLSPDRQGHAAAYLGRAANPGGQDDARVSPIFLIDDKASTEEMARELLAWELSRLADLGGDVAIAIPKGLSLDERLKALRNGISDQGNKPVTAGQIAQILASGKTLSLAHESQLLALLRAANEMKRGSSNDSLETVLRQLALRELKGILSEIPNGRAPIPQEVRPVLEKLLGGGKLTPESVRRILADPRASLSAADLTRLLGAFRVASYKQRGQDFIGDIRGDAFRDSMYAYNKIREQIRRAMREGLKPPPLPRDPFEGAWPGGFSITRRGITGPKPPSAIVEGFLGGCPAPGGGGHAQGFEDFTPGPSRTIIRPSDGAISMRGTPPSRISLDPRDESRLLALRSSGSPALQTASFFDDDLHQYSKCQGTVVKKTVTGQGCDYDLATAAHCVLKHDDGPTRSISHYAVAPFGWVQVERGGIDQSRGGDFAMVTFHAQCLDVPVVPLAPAPPRDGEGIMVYGARKPLIGQASDTAGGANLVQMNVRDPANSGLGIYQGDSGGPVLNSRGQLAGVISSKLVGNQFHGIGFFASKGSLQWANRYVNPSFIPTSDERLLAASSSQPTAETH